jgi:hypothetical protein
MRPKSSEPNWWMLYLILPIFMLLGWIVTRLSMSDTVREIALIASLVLVFYLANHWFNDHADYFAGEREKEPIPVPEMAHENQVAFPSRPRRMQRSRVLRAFYALSGALLVLACTLPLAAIGPRLLGEGVIALLYLLPIGWVTARWGQTAGVSAALTAALCFDFCFIPPYYTFQVANLEGWLLLVLFSAASVFLVGRAVRRYAGASQKEEQAAFLFELVALVDALPDREDIAILIAERLREFYQAAFVKVIFYQRAGQLSILKVRTAPGVKAWQTMPGRKLPIRCGVEIVGEITIEGSAQPLPGDDDPLLQSVCHLAALALDRGQTIAPAGARDGFRIQQVS